MSDLYPVIEESTRNGDDWIHSCGTTVLSKIVIHPIHDGFIPLAGSGSVQREDVPYCPKCQEEPSTNGAPITRAFIDEQEAAIMRRMRSG